MSWHSTFDTYRPSYKSMTCTLRIFMMLYYEYSRELSLPQALDIFWFEIVKPWQCTPTLSIWKFDKISYFANLKLWTFPVKHLVRVILSYLILASVVPYRGPGLRFKRPVSLSISKTNLTIIRNYCKMKYLLTLNMTIAVPTSALDTEFSPN